MYTVVLQNTLRHIQIVTLYCYDLKHAIFDILTSFMCNNPSISLAGSIMTEGGGGGGGRGGTISNS